MGNTETGVECLGRAVGEDQHVGWLWLWQGNTKRKTKKKIENRDVPRTIGQNQHKCFEIVVLKVGNIWFWRGEDGKRSKILERTYVQMSVIV